MIHRSLVLIALAITIASCGATKKFFKITNTETGAVHYAEKVATNGSDHTFLCMGHRSTITVSDPIVAEIPELTYRSGIGEARNFYRVQEENLPKKQLFTRKPAEAPKKRKLFERASDGPTPTAEELAAIPDRPTEFQFFDGRTYKQVVDDYRAAERAKKAQGEDKPADAPSEPVADQTPPEGPTQVEPVDTFSARRPAKPTMPKARAAAGPCPSAPRTSRTTRPRASPGP